MPRPFKLPDEDHPIQISLHPKMVRVIFENEVIAQTDKALALKEANYPVVFYLPYVSVKQAVLQPSAHTSFCPYKGDAAYYHLCGTQGLIENALWHYPNPCNSVAEIAGHVAFYPDAVDSIEFNE